MRSRKKRRRRKDEEEEVAALKAISNELIDVQRHLRYSPKTFWDNIDE